MRSPAPLPRPTKRRARAAPLASRLALTLTFATLAPAAGAQVREPAPPADAAPDAETIGFRTWQMVPPEDAGTTNDPPRRAPGPSVRERGTRTRRAPVGSGALMILVLVGAMAYYVIKRLRR